MTIVLEKIEPHGTNDTEPWTREEKLLTLPFPQLGRWDFGTTPLKRTGPQKADGIFDGPKNVDDTQVPSLGGPGRPGRPSATQ
ncbi:hypothetical protein N7532_008974 [Penicillium argentinense]|uniref:Uncharacterized protein n=1 Tax=Penicillium argentinense TaxID=1131581 RepID=A0A9W9EYN5_9EURO|nr:uncharacterized protein N7532_008974 [Penicillium argentinense]KAJ5090290.1 hypothetical protein N7532_008974 [Penicillium argentinense]